MKIGIVPKLFLLTTALCLFVLALLFIGQTVFFKQFYVNQKIKSVQAALQSYVRDGLNANGDARDAAKREQSFYQTYNSWITVLDAKGNMKDADDFYMEIQLDRTRVPPELAGTTLVVPLYSVSNVEDFIQDSPSFIDTWIQEGQHITIEGLLMNDRLVVQRVARSSALRDENRLENRPLVNKEHEVVSRFKTPFQYHEKYPDVVVNGTIKKVVTPVGAGVSRYTNHLFLERVKAFQADLLYGDYDVHSDSSRMTDYEENNVPYKMFVDRTEDQDGNHVYLFAMTSLQPVNEAVGVLQNYYGYVLAGTLLLALLASFYYSRRVARPLLRMNETTQKIAALDFSEKIPITTRDEIGELSRNINELSERLRSHIAALEQDIEKEKRLEQTRKQFISGVSHELKTPLSVIQSCISILKDEVANHKRDYYFSAVEDEVKKMDLLVSDMLELSKYESGTYRMVQEPFDIAAVTERICGKFASVVAEKRMQLHTRLNNVAVVANQHRIEQVIVNFVTNAIRYTPEQSDIYVWTVEKPDTVKVCIENKGARIPDDQMGSIWDRFYRGDRSRHRAAGGTGLGLAICKQILELHRVPYGAANTEDGVVFYFELNKAVEV